MQRRDFLRLLVLGGSSLAAAWVLPGCGKRRPEGVPDAFEEIARGVGKKAKPGLNVAQGAGEFLPGSQRVPVGLLTPQGTPMEGVPARAWTGHGASPRGPFPLVYRPFSVTHQHPAGQEEDSEPHGYYDATFAFDAPGVWDLMVEAGSGDRLWYGFLALQVREQPTVPAPGQPAVSVATPTFADPRGIAAVCTREPPCPMHEVSLDEALRAGKPVVFTIATPRLCTSRVCGPVVDEVMAVRNQVGDRATFIHAEVYQDLSGTQSAPAVTAWRLESEPWVFVIDAAGNVRERFEGPVVAADVAAAAQKVL